MRGLTCSLIAMSALALVACSTTSSGGDVSPGPSPGPNQGSNSGPNPGPLPNPGPKPGPVNPLPGKDVVKDPDLPFGVSWRATQRFRLFNLDSRRAASDVEPVLNLLAPGARASYDRVMARLLDDRTSLYTRTFFEGRRRLYADNYLYPATYPVAVELAGDAPEGVCTFRVTTSSLSVQAACAAEVELALPAAGPIDPGLPSAASRTGRGQIEVLQGDKVLARADLVVRDRLIVAMGDSFSSGEGNPDRPSNLAAYEPPQGAGSAWWTAKNGTRAKIIGPKWLDPACGRSLYSWPMISAMRAAAQSTSDVVTFAHFGCSGAQVVDGLLTAQSALVGLPAVDGKPQAEKLGQIGQLALLLCRNNPKRIQGVGGFARPVTIDNPGGTVFGVQKCLNPERGVDQVLMSVGGNDVGFGGVLKWAITPRGNIFGNQDLDRRMDKELGRICPSPQSGPGCGLPGVVTAKTLLDDPRRLPVYYATLRRVWETAVGAPMPATALMKYPDSLRDQTGAERCGKAHAAAIEGMRGVLPWFAAPGAWDLSIDENELEEIGSYLLVKLWSWQDAEGFGANGQRRWTIIDNHINPMAAHGWCATAPGEQLAFPQPKGFPGKGWDGTSPVTFNPYARRVRWIRTPNDAILTEVSSGEPDLRPLKGAFHPNAEGHFAMADAAYEDALSRWALGTPRS